jgi:hypothetical protein
MGSAAWKGTRRGRSIRRRTSFFEEALQYDSSFAAAYDGISDAHTMLACRGMTPAIASFHKAKAAARRAVRLQPELEEGYASLAHVRLHDWDWVGLESDFRQAVELDPGYAIAHYWYAECLYVSAVLAASSFSRPAGLIRSTAAEPICGKVSQSARRRVAARRRGDSSKLQ